MAAEGRPNEQSQQVAAGAAPAATKQTPGGPSRSPRRSSGFIIAVALALALARHRLLLRHQHQHGSHSAVH